MRDKLDPSLSYFQVPWKMPEKSCASLLRPRTYSLILMNSHAKDEKSNYFVRKYCNTTTDYQPISLLSRFKLLQQIHNPNNNVHVDPDQMASDLDLHCFKDKAYPGSAWQGLIFQWQNFSLNTTQAMPLYLVFRFISHAQSDLKCGGQ